MTIQGSGSDAHVGISDPFFVGQDNFLRAWACIQSLACEQSEPLVAKQLTWNKTSKDNPMPPPKSCRQGSLRSSATITESNENDDMGTNGGPQTSSATESLGLTEVSIDDVEILESLGYGHNGVVYLAKWGGQKVALKQFDVGKDG